jgi:hypothetical protein
VAGATGATGAERIDVPLGFDVPEGWTPVDPASVGAAGVAFVLVRPSPDGEFTPNVTIGVDRRSDDGGVADSARESLLRLESAMADVSLVDRQSIGDARSPGITQVVRLRPKPGPDGPGRELVQSQVHLTVPLGDAPHDRLVVELACTCLPEQTDAVVPAFQRLVATFHIREKEIDTHER